MPKRPRPNKPVTIDSIVDAYNRELVPLITRIERELTTTVERVEDLEMGVFELVDVSNTLALEHANGYVTVTNGAACSLEVPPDVFAVGTEIQVAQGGAGQLTIVAGTGVTIVYAETLRLRKQEASGVLTCLAANAWRFSGDAELA